MVDAQNPVSNPPPRKRYVVGFFIDRKARKVLLIKKNRPEAWAGRMTGLGGKIEPGETPERAMQREFLEECGLNISTWKHTVFLDTQEFTLDFFVAFGNPHKARQMESEELVVASLDALPEAMFSNARWSLSMSLDERMQFPVSLAYTAVPGAQTPSSTPAGTDAAAVSETLR